MRKITVAGIALLVVFTFAVGAGAAPTLTFDIDFEQDGIMDTGGTYFMMVGDSVAADLYFSVTEEGIVGGGFGIDLGSHLTGDFTLDPPLMEIQIVKPPGYIGVEFIAWPPGTVVGPGSGMLIGTLNFTAIGLGITDIILDDFNSNVQWVTSPSGIVLDDQMGVHLGSINSIPIPAAAWLLASGLMGLLGIRKKSRKA